MKQIAYGSVALLLGVASAQAAERVVFAGDFAPQVDRKSGV